MGDAVEGRLLEYYDENQILGSDRGIPETVDEFSPWAGFVRRQLRLTRFLYSVYVFIAFALGEYRVVHGSGDPKGKLQLTVF